MSLGVAAMIYALLKDSSIDIVLSAIRIGSLSVVCNMNVEATCNV